MSILLKRSVETISKNPLLSLGAFSVALLVSFFLFLMSGVGYLIDQSVANVEDKIDVTIFLRREISFDHSTLRSMRDELQQAGFQVTQLSAKDALTRLMDASAVPELIADTANFVEEYQKTDTLQPLLIIGHIKSHMVDRLSEILKNPTYIDLMDSSFLEEQFDRVRSFSSITSLSRTVYVCMSVLFLGIAFLILFNTTRILIFTRSKEIEIMELVGASRRTIEVPFYMEMVLLVVLGVVASFAVLFLLLLQAGWIIPASTKDVMSLGSLFGNVIHTLGGYITGWGFLELGKLLLIFVVIASLSVAFALRKYLPRM